MAALLVLTLGFGQHGAAEPAEPATRAKPAPPPPIEVERSSTGAVELADEEVIVVVSRTESAAATLPLAVTTRELAPLAVDGPGLSLADSAAAIPGVALSNRFNLAQDTRISIRGFGARSPFGIRGVTVVLDGIPLTLADGLAQIDLIDPQLLGRIEVLRGPAGALYGNAAGGVLYLETAGGARRTGEDVSLIAGGYGLRKLIARAAETSDSGSIAIAASALSFDGFRQHAAAEQRTVHGTLRWKLGHTTELRIVAALVDAPTAQDPGGLTREELQADPRQAAPNNLRFETGEVVVQSQLGALLRARVDRATVELRAYHGGRSYQGAIPFRFIELNRNAFGAGAIARATYHPGGKRLRLALATEASALRDRRIQFDNDGGRPAGSASLHQDERVRAVGAYAQAQLWLTERVSLLAGARHDRSRFSLRDRIIDDGDASDQRSFAATTGMLGASIAAGAQLVVFSNLAQAFETPTITELSLRPDGAPGFVDSLSPQRATSFELGSRGRWGRFGAELSAYYTGLRDELISFEDRTGRSFYRNAGRSHRLGAELAVTVRLPRGLTFTGAYTYIRARFDDYVRADMQLAGAAVPGIAPHRIAGRTRWALWRGLFAAFDVDYSHATYADDANQHLRASQWLLGCRLGYRTHVRRYRFELDAGVANALNTTYVDNLRINAVGGRYFEPGTPRLWFASATVGWRRAE